MSTTPVKHPPAPSTLKEQGPIQYVSTSHGVVEYLITGEGPVTVLSLHGAMGGYDQADLLTRTVGSPGFRYLSISRPGYLGTALSVGQSPEEQADVYAEILDMLGIEKTVVLAISGGGPSAIHFALRHPDRCRGLILISTCAGSVKTPLPFAFHMLKWLACWPALLRFMNRKAPKDLESNLRRSISDPAILARTLQGSAVRPLLEELTAMGFDRTSQRLPGTFNDVTTTRTNNYPLEQIKVPVLAVHGTRDPFLPFDQHGKMLATRIQGAELLPVDGGEHVAIFTHRDIVRARILQFLKQVSTDTQQ